MRITFCGTGCGAGVNPDRAGAAIHIASGAGGPDDAGVLLDCGPGWMDRYLRAGLDPRSLRGVVLSHLHYDHAMGITELLMRWPHEGYALPTFYGPRDMTEYMEGARTFVQHQHRYSGKRARHWLDELAVTETSPGDERSIDGLQVETWEVPHVEYLECVARRIRADGRSVVYSGDTRPAAEVMVPRSEGAEVLIHEAYTERALEAFIDEGGHAAVGDNIRAAFANPHSGLAEVATIAQAAGGGRLVLTHLLAAESSAEMVREAGA